jgi:Zn-dependent protease/predicted transcriptional regulator
MLGRSFRIARVAGVDVEIHPSWFLIVGYLAWALSKLTFPSAYDGWSTATYWAVGVSSAILLFVTVFIHEFAHAIVAIRRGLPVPKITLFIFGGVSHLSRQPRSAGEEFAIASAGPFTSIAIAIVTSIAAFFLQDVSEHAVAILGYLAFINFLLAVFNALPGFPLDGGRVLRSIAWKRTGSFRRATQIAAGAGVFVGWGMIIGATAFVLAGLYVNGVMLMLVGWFLLSAARSEAQGIQLDAILGRLKARDVMREDFPTVVPGAAVQTVVDDIMIGQGERAVVVALGGSVLGILSVTDVQRAPRHAWPNTPVQTLMTPRDRVRTVNVNDPALDVLLLLGQHRLNQVPVLDDGRMVGLVTRRELIDRVELAERLAPDETSVEPDDRPRDATTS